MDFLYILPIIVTFAGAYFLFKLRFFFMLHPKKTAKKIKKAIGEKGAFRSVSLALAGTLGIGNIIGVAVGICVGGPGAVFWLLISSLFAMVIKYAEASLCADFGEGKGMVGVVAKSFGRLSQPISIVYSALILAICFVMGAALQSASIGQCAALTLGISEKLTSIILVAVLLFSIIGGSLKIEKITMVLIPMTTIIYILLSCFAILINIEKIPEAFLNVMSGAFEVDSAIGGIIGFLLSDKIKEGYLRGILSNEAGAGTSSIAHSINKSNDAGAVGVMGMLEVVFDTVILCMLTAFATLVSVDDFSGLSGMQIIMAGIGSVFGGVSEYFLCFCIFAFAYSTVICWYYYGRFAYSCLFRRKSSLLFSVCFLTSAFLGSRVHGDFLIGVTDIILLSLSVISLSALIKNSDRIKFLSERSGIITRR